MSLIDKDFQYSHHAIVKANKVNNFLIPPTSWSVFKLGRSNFDTTIYSVLGTSWISVICNSFRVNWCGDCTDTK